MIQVNFTKQIEVNGFTLLVTVDAEASVVHDNYGADADGNRGEWRTDLEDFSMVVFDGHAKEITEKLATKHPELFKEIEEEAEKRLFSEYENTLVCDYDYPEGEL